MHSRLHFFLMVGLLIIAGCNSHGREEGRSATDLPPNVSNQFATLMDLDDPSAFRAAAEERGFQTAESGVVLDVQTRDLADSDRPALDLPGVRVRSFHPQYERISAVARGPAAVRAIAGLSFVRVVAPSFGAKTNTGGSSGGAY